MDHYHQVIGAEAGRNVGDLSARAMPSEPGINPDARARMKYLADFTAG
jgi:hypothetical protein